MKQAVARVLPGLIGAGCLAFAIFTTYGGWFADSSRPRAFWLWLFRLCDYSTPFLWFINSIVGLSGVSFILWAICPGRLRKLHDWLMAADIATSDSKAKDGTSAFLGLATFALAEGGALTVVARGEGQTRIVLAIYIIAVSFTLCWIVSVLRSTVDEQVLGTGMPTNKVRAYDDTSLKFGRFALSWTIFLAFIMSFLALNQLLPNQTHRVAYTVGSVPINKPSLLASMSHPLQRIVSTASIRDGYEKWVEWTKDAENLVWLEQQDAFTDYYTSFVANVSCVAVPGTAANAEIKSGAAFLVRWDSDNNVLTYRQLAFRSNNKWDIFHVVDPNPGETLLVVVRLEGATVNDVTFSIATGK